MNLIASKFFVCFFIYLHLFRFERSRDGVDDRIRHWRCIFVKYKVGIKMEIQSEREEKQSKKSGARFSAWILHFKCVVEYNKRKTD